MREMVGGPVLKCHGGPSEQDERGCRRYPSASAEGAKPLRFGSLGERRKLPSAFYLRGIWHQMETISDYTMQLFRQ